MRLNFLLLQQVRLYPVIFLLLKLQQEMGLRLLTAC